MRKKLDRLWLIPLLFVAISIGAKAVTNITVINLYAEPTQRIAVAQRRQDVAMAPAPPAPAPRIIYRDPPLVEQYTEDEELPVEEVPAEEMTAEEMAAEEVVQ
ncbi:MAG: hypothetical protein ACRCSK_07950 [Fusobacteriaceae bacterium]